MQADHRAMASAALGIGAVGAGVAVSDHLTRYPVLTAQAVRYAAGAALLAALARATRREPERRLDATGRALLVGLALSGMVVFNVAVVRAVDTGEPAVVATIVGLAPIGLALVVPAVERRRPRPAIVAGACLAAAGAAVVEGFGRADGASLAWSTVALGGEVAFTALAAPLLRTLTPLGLAVRACAVAAVLLAATSLLVDGRTAVPRPGPGVVAAVAYLAVASTALAFVLWYTCVSRVGTARAGLLTGIAPISAAATGVALGGPPPSLLVWLGVAVVAAGLGLGLAKRERVRLDPGAQESDLDGELAERPAPADQVVQPAVP
ncbi:MAG TPA: DMT family transporter [Acidimicrobiales bacterium]